jgi:hypothetical protein
MEVPQQTRSRGWGHSSGVKCYPGMHKALGFIPSACERARAHTHTHTHTHTKVSHSSSRYVPKGNEISVALRYLHAHVHCSIIRNSQDVETT